MLRELSKVEQRYGEVLGALRGGYRVGEVAEAYGFPESL
jgi:hypothetical protein